jgi:hypothetical protein
MSSGPQADRTARWAYLRQPLGGADGAGAVLGAREIEELLGGGGTGGALELDPSWRELPAGAGGARGTSSEPATYLEDELSRVRGENQHLRQLASRAQEELGRALQRMRELGGDPSELSDPAGEGGEDGAALPPWVASPQYLSPLLQAYDARVMELRSASSAAERQLSEARDHIVRLTRENEQLEADLASELESRQRELEARVSGPGEPGGAGMGSGAAGVGVGVVASETIAMLNELIDTLQRENGVLTARDAILAQDVERLSEQGRERDAQMVKVAHNFQAAAGALKQSKAELESLRGERDGAVAQLQATTQSLSEAAVERDQLRAGLAERERASAALVQQVQRLRSDLEELAAKANAESELQEQAVVAAHKRARALQLELDVSAQELEAARLAHGEERARCEGLRRDLDNALAALQQHRGELAALRAAADGAALERSEARALSERAALERAQALALATARKDEVARLHEARAGEAREAVRAREAVAREAHAAARGQLAARAAETAAAEVRCARLAAELERARADGAAATARAEAVRRAAGDDVGRLEAQAFKLTERTEAAEIAAIEREADAARTAQAAGARVAEAEAERAASLEALSALRAQLAAALAEAQSTRDELRRGRADAEAADKDAARVRGELAALRQATEARVESLEQRFRLAEQQLSVRAAQAEQRAGELAQELDALKTLQERARAHAADELGATQAHFERIVAEQREEVVRLRARGDELAAQLAAVQGERAEAAAAAVAADARARKLEQAVAVAERRSTEAKQRLAELLAGEERRLQEASQLRRRADAAEVSLQRAVRERDAALEALEAPSRSRAGVPAPRSPKIFKPRSPSSRSDRLRLETEDM